MDDPDPKMVLICGPEHHRNEIVREILKKLKASDSPILEVPMAWKQNLW